MTRRSALAAAALAAGVLVAGVAAPAQAAPVKYKNCTAVHTKYKGGIAKKGAKDKRSGGGHAKYAPHVDTALYNANSKLDRDRDGIACEQ